MPLPSYYNGLTSFYTPNPAPHQAGDPWTVLNHDGTYQTVPWNEAGLHTYERDMGGGNTEYTATSDPSEIAHKDRQFKTASNQAAIKIAAGILGGTALTGGFAGAGAGAGADALQPITVGAETLPGGYALPAAGESMAAFPSLGGAVGGSAAGSLSESIAGTPFQASGEYGAVSGTPDATAASGEAGGGSNFLQRLFHMGGNLAKGGGQQRQPYHYQNPAVADYAQQQVAAEMLAEALSKRQPVDPVVRGGPTPVSPFGQQRY